jgi:hypothetical protein
MGRGRRITHSTSENVAVVAPMPKASIRTAVDVNPGDFSRFRIAMRTSWIGMGGCSSWTLGRVIRPIGCTCLTKYDFS